MPGSSVDSDAILYGDFDSRQRELLPEVLFSDQELVHLMPGYHVEGLRSWGHCRCGVYKSWYALTDHLPDEWKHHSAPQSEFSSEQRSAKRLLNRLDQLGSTYNLDRLLRPVELSVDEQYPSDLQVTVAADEQHLRLKLSLPNGAIRRRAIEYLLGSTEQVDWYWVDYLPISSTHRQEAFKGLLGLDQQRVIVGVVE